ncbi:MAG: hypothetical protein HND47_14380 [Chloroflexi bacterium]|nr:hypothetical protein [Chloroflexota bacterium]
MELIPGVAFPASGKPFALPQNRRMIPVPEGRQTPREQADGDCAVIHRGARLPCGKDAQHNADQNREKLPRPDQQNRIPQTFGENLPHRAVGVITDAQFPFQQIANINEELRVQRVDIAVPDLDGVQRLEAVDDRLIQPETGLQHLDRFLFQARVANPRPRRVARQDAEQKEVEDNDK